VTKADIMHIYDRSVYQIRLDVAAQLFCGSGLLPTKCLERADEFVRALLAEQANELSAKFTL
jgi:hypothetical protein